MENKSLMSSTGEGSDAPDASPRTRARSVGAPAPQQRSKKKSIKTCFSATKKRISNLFMCLDSTKPGINARRTLFVMTPFCVAVLATIIVTPYHYGPGADNDHCTIGIPRVSNFVNFLTWVNVCTSGWTAWDPITNNYCEDITPEWVPYNATYSKQQEPFIEQNTTSEHKFDGKIGKIYYINRDEDTERRAYMDKQLDKLGIEYERFPAVQIESARELVDNYASVSERGISRCLLKSFNVISSALYGKQIARPIAPNGFDLWMSRMQAYQKQACDRTKGTIDGGEFYTWDQLKNFTEYENLGMATSFSVISRRLCMDRRKMLEHYLSHARLTELIKSRHGGVGSMDDGRLYLVLEDDARVPIDVQERLKHVWQFVPTDMDSLRIGFGGKSRSRDQRNKCVLYPSAPFYEPNVHDHHLTVYDFNQYYDGTFAYVVTPFEGKLDRHVHHLKTHFITRLQTVLAAGEAFKHYILQYPIVESAADVKLESDTYLTNAKECGGSNIHFDNITVPATPPADPAATCTSASADDSAQCSGSGGKCYKSKCNAGSVAFAQECGGSCSCCLKLKLSKFRYHVAFDVEISMATWAPTPTGYTFTKFAGAACATALSMSGAPEGAVTLEKVLPTKFGTIDLHFRVAPSKDSSALLTLLHKKAFGKNFVKAWNVDPLNPNMVAKDALVGGHISPHVESTLATLEIGAGEESHAKALAQHIAAIKLDSLPSTTVVRENNVSSIHLTFNGHVSHDATRTSINTAVVTIGVETAPNATVDLVGVVEEEDVPGTSEAIDWDLIGTVVLIVVGSVTGVGCVWTCARVFLPQERQDGYADLYEPERNGATSSLDQALHTQTTGLSRDSQHVVRT